MVGQRGATLSMDWGKSGPRLPCALLLACVLPSAWAAPRIPPGPLEQALRAYSLASGALLTADGRLTAGLASPGLEQVGETGADLARLLAGTGLQALPQGDGSYLLRPVPLASSTAAAPGAGTPTAGMPAASAAEQRLPTVTSTAAADSPYQQPASRYALKSAAPLHQLPQALSVVTAQRIAEQGVSSMGELLQHVAGVQASQGEGNRDAAVFRGYNSSADFYLDGIRDDVQYYRDFYNVATVEVLKGPNAMALGRGSSGGAVNRVAKQPEWRDFGEARATIGSWQLRRASVDVNRQLDEALALRVNAVAEDDDAYRHGVGMARQGVNPVLAWRGAGTVAQAGYEHYRDSRVTDRGVPSWQGRPVATDPGAFFGDPQASRNAVTLDAVTARVEHELDGGALFSSQLRYARYDKYYSNVFPGTVQDGGASVLLLGYRSATQRANLFYQADWSATLEQGGWRHQVGAGVELGRQRTGNQRATGYFDSLGAGVRFLTAPLDSPTVSLPVSYRPAATDPANASKADNLAIYVQDQLRLAPDWQLFAGLRAERFRFDFRDLVNQRQLGSRDRPLSPRAALIYHPMPELSMYASYSTAYTPRAGEQLTSLTVDNQCLQPEQVRNVELGARWDGRDGWAASLALYRLRRSNVLVADSTNPDLLQLVDGQRGRGLELELEARRAGWRWSASYAWQDSILTADQSATVLAGARMPHVPRHTLSLWARHALAARLDGALGVVARSAMFSSTSNLVTLPGHARLDGGLYYGVDARQSVRLIAENLLDRRYFISSYNDNNILPGAPRTWRLTWNRDF